MIYVSWYEADAYCRWLDEQRGIEIRLPKEEEWQRAATPAKGEYPWGEEEPDAERANFAPSFDSPNVGSPTPVGIYPAGDGRHGHSDLAGNVWEWCLERYEGKNAKEIWPDEEIRVLRGGGWYDSAEALRAAVRFGFPASGRHDGVGFRVSAAPASR